MLDMQQGPNCKVRLPTRTRDRFRSLAIVPVINIIRVNAAKKLKNALGKHSFFSAKFYY